ncbi:hypothetical protein G4B88_016077 [Cannabis sativa]|uniref:Cellulose synthase n=1 Tax=Cannabis sativa TaxID=3483 RepID=A0A7J6EY63_CANSA|nr:hypothetical protein G4B88_016077 [Cannabis sativa]
MGKNDDDDVPLFETKSAKRCTQFTLFVGTILRCEEKNLLGVDIFVCTVDPKAEPSLMVVNTVLSVMAYDYPPHKLSVYLSDDGASELTFYALLEASEFSKKWLPFCNKFKVEPRSSEAYFTNNEASQPLDDHHGQWASIKIPRLWTLMDIDGHALPTLVYLAREKRPQYHHNFKAGAMNSLLSAQISNAPIVDCGMYSNYSESVRDAMCFLLDKEKGHEIAYIQFPSAFENLTENDIYSGSLRLIMEVDLRGFDSNGGPCYIGTGCFHRRESLSRKKYNEAKPLFTKVVPLPTI